MYVRFSRAYSKLIDNNLSLPKLSGDCSFWSSIFDVESGKDDPLEGNDEYCLVDLCEKEEWGEYHSFFRNYKFMLSPWQENSSDMQSASGLWISQHAVALTILKRTGYVWGK